MSLKAAVTKLEANDVSGAIPLLLEAWRASPDPRLGDALEALDARITRPALSAPTHKKLTEEFCALVAKKDPLDLPRLVAVVGTTRSGFMVEQLEAMLEHWPADPRVTTPFLQLLKRPPFTGSATQSAWRRMFKLLQQWADPRLIDRLAALDFAELLKETSWQGGVDANAFAAGFFTERATAVVNGVKKKWAKGLPAVAAKDEALLVRLLELAKPAPEAALISEVQAAPSKDGARQVLADHLLEKNDVRGQFMALQQVRALGKLTPEQAKEEQRLREQFGVQWIGELAALVEHETMQFENGFLSSCVIDGDRIGVVKELTGNPAWATVRHLHLAGNAFPRELLAHPAMKSLTSVSGIRDQSARTLLTGPDVFPWTSVGIDLPHYESVDADVKLLTSNLGRVFPNLKELVVDGYSLPPDVFGWLWTSQFEHLSRVGVAAVAPGSTKKWLDVMLRRAPKDATLELSTYFHLGFLVRLSRGADGTRSVLDLRSRAAWGVGKTTFDELAKQVSALAGTLTLIRLHDRSTKAQRAALEKLLAPGGAIENAV